MKNAATLAALVMVSALSNPAAAQATTDSLVEVDTGRTQGVFTKTPVFIRAILARPAHPTDTALLYFRGAPGYARITSTDDKMRNAGSILRPNLQLLAREGITLVVMDCPTDQWGGPADAIPANCLDDYRSSQAHADDVRGIMARLRGEYGLTRFYIMGHSAGTLSTRWLAKNLGNEIAGSIHSATLTVPNSRGFGASLAGFRFDTIAAPVLQVHHENDACSYSPYAAVQAYAGGSLITVRGGSGAGDPCGAGHYHSYQGREAAVVKAIVDWIRTGRVERTVGE